MRTRATNDLTVAETICAKLAKEVTEFENALIEATIEVEARASAVLAAEAIVIAERFYALLDEARWFQRRLGLMSRQSLSHPVIPKRPDGHLLFSQAKRMPTMPAIVTQAINEPHVQGAAVLSQTLAKKEAEAVPVREHWKELCAGNADHTLDEIEDEV